MFREARGEVLTCKTVSAASECPLLVLAQPEFLLVKVGCNPVAGHACHLGLQSTVRISGESSWAESYKGGTGLVGFCCRTCDMCVVVYGCNSNIRKKGRGEEGRGKKGREGKG